MKKRRSDYLLMNIGEEVQKEQCEHEEGEHIFSESYHEKKEEFLNSFEKTINRQYYLRKIATVAAMVVLFSSLSVGMVYAATRLIQGNVTLNNETGESVSVQVDKNTDEYIPPIEITPGYLPAGYKEDGGGKFSPNGDYGDGITIIDAGYYKNLNLEDVSDFEEKQIGEAKAIIFHREGYAYPYNIFLFYEKTGHVIEIFGCEAVSKKELFKVCENLTYREVPEKDPDYNNQAFSWEEKMKKDAVAQVDLSNFDNERGASQKINDSQLIGKKEKFTYFNYDAVWKEDLNETDAIKATIEKIVISDQVDKGKINKNNTAYLDMVQDCLTKENTWKPYTRVVEEWNNKKLIKKEIGTVPVKNVKITLTIQNNSNSSFNDVAMSPYWKNLKSTKGGYEIYESIPGYKMGAKFRGVIPYGVGHENFPYYFDCSGYPNNQHFYFMKLKGKETKTIHLWYAIPEDQLEDCYIEFPTKDDKFPTNDNKMLYVKVMN